MGVSEENIPLSQSVHTNDHDDDGAKGKGRAMDGEPIFDVGEGSEDESEYRDRRV